MKKSHLRAVPDDRRERGREQRRDRYLDAAQRIIDRAGLDGVTMQALADELDCAVGTAYTYFPSKASLLVALQRRAVDTLATSYRTARARWDEALADDPELHEDPGLTVLVQLSAVGGFFAAASVVFADEFVLQRHLLRERPAPGSEEEVGQAVSVLLGLLDAPRALLDEAVSLEVLEAGDSLDRSVRWLAALDGVASLDNLSAVDRHLFRAQHHSRALTTELLVGWGADRMEVEVASSHLDKLAALGPLAPPPDGGGW